MKKLILILLLAFLSLGEIYGQERTIQRADTDGNALAIPFVDIAVRQPESNREVALSIQLLLILAVITISPSIILLTTSFLRIAVVFDFIKRALSLQQVPPNQVLMGIALFLTVFYYVAYLQRSI